MATVFDLLEEIRKRPTMFLGGDTTDRHGQLERLEWLLDGYRLALMYHRIHEPVHDFNREFGTFIFERTGKSTSCGPASAIREASQTQEEAWTMYWALIDEFRGNAGR